MLLTRNLFFSFSPCTGYKLRVKDIIQSALFSEAGLESGVGHAGGVGGRVMVRDLDLFSYCMSCLLPFQVKCQVVGLTKRLQDLQHVADEVCSALQHGIMPTGVAVILQCSHVRLPKFESAFLDLDQHGWFVVTSGSGVFGNEKEYIWREFLNLLKFRGIDLENTLYRSTANQFWCPSRSFSEMQPANSEMVTTVASIIQSLGEDPLRKELLGTPTRFVKWLMNFKTLIQR